MAPRLRRRDARFAELRCGTKVERIALSTETATAAATRERDTRKRETA